MFEAVLAGLVLNHFRAAADRGHALAAGIPTHHSKTSIGFEDALQHHSVARFEDVQRQNVAWKENDIRQRKERQFSDGQISHAGINRRERS